MNGIVTLAIFILAIANFGVWRPILFSGAGIGAPEAWFLNVGQGESQLLKLPRQGSGKPVKILIDAGPNRRAVEELDKALGAYADKYIDIAILTHAALDHYGGFDEILRRYDVGAFIYNGRASEATGFQNLKKTLREERIPIVALGAGSEIIYAQNTLSALSPDSRMISHRDVNESSLVLLYDSGNTGTEHARHNARVLFTSDIGFPAENHILASGKSIAADILKVGHHGSRFSSSATFVSAVRPEISVISVGRNRYGHPTRQALDILERAGSRIYRTDLDGTVRLVLDAAWR